MTCELQSKDDVARNGRSKQPSEKTPRVSRLTTELHRLHVLGTRAFRTLTLREGYLLAFTQLIETDTLQAL